MFGRLAELVLTRRVASTVVLIALVAVAALGVWWVEIDYRVTSFFSRSDDALAVLARYEAAWGPDDDILLVVGTARTGDLLDPERLSEVQTLGEALAELPTVEGVVSIATAPVLRRLGMGLIDPRTVAQARPPDAQRVPAWREEVLTGPYVPALLSNDARYGAILVQFPQGSDDLKAVEALISDVRGVLATRDGTIDWQLAGIPAVREAFFDALVRDQVVFVPLAVLFIAVTLFVVFRRTAGVIAPLVAAFVPTAVVVGLLGWTGESIGVLNQVYFTLLPVIAIADAIHVVARTYEEAGSEPLGPEAWRRAITRSLARIGSACFLTSVTTGIGFLSLTTARMHVLRSFGLYAAAGVAVAFVTTLVVVPILLSISRPRRLPPERVRGPLDAVLRAFAVVSVRHPWVVLGVTGAAVVVGFGLAFQVEVDNHVSQALDPSHPVSVANHLADAHLGGMVGIGLDVRADLDDPEVVAALDRIEEAYRREPMVRDVVGPGTVHHRLFRLMAGREGTAPDADQLARVYAGVPAATWDGLVRPDRDRARVRIRLRDDGGQALQALVGRMEAVAAAELGDGGDALITGTSVVAYRGVMQVTSDLRYSLLVAFGIIALTILALFRNVRVAVICLIPNGLPLLAGYAWLGGMGWVLDPVPAVIFTVALGIAVDDTIHLLARVGEELSAGRRLEDAVTAAIEHSGRAVVITTVVLVGGLLVNAVSAFPAIRTLSVLGALVITVALLCDLLVLPALLVVFKGRGERYRDEV